MRKIMFRAQDDVNGDWISGYLVKDADVKNRWYICNNYNDGIIVKPETIGQFTGLKDKNNKDIYEGDILSPLAEEIGPMWIAFENGCFVAYNKFCKWGPLYRIQEKDFLVSVIGNIHENPELLSK